MERRHSIHRACLRWASISARASAWACCGSISRTAASASPGESPDFASAPDHAVPTYTRVEAACTIALISSPRSDDAGASPFGHPRFQDPRASMACSKSQALQRSKFATNHPTPFWPRSETVADASRSRHLRSGASPPWPSRGQAFSGPRLRCCRSSRCRRSSGRSFETKRDVRPGVRRA